jgi:hypothetical protein
LPKKSIGCPGSLVGGYSSSKTVVPASSCVLHAATAPLPFTLSGFLIYYLQATYFQPMNALTRKRISVVFLVFAILWFVWIGLREAHYVRNVIAQKATLHHVLRTIYEEQIEGIHFVTLVIFLVPGVFALFMHFRFRREY